MNEDAFRQRLTVILAETLKSKKKEKLGSRGGGNCVRCRFWRDTIFKTLNAIFFMSALSFIGVLFLLH